MFMGPTDEEIINEFTGELKNILNLELEAKNKVSETYKGDWPYPHCKMVFLEYCFLTPIRRNIDGIEFRNINDPHYWKAEYYDSNSNQFLCCGFSGLNPNQRFNEL